MELQFAYDHEMLLQERKFSQNTCASFSDNSPNSDDRRHDDCSVIKSLKAFSPASPSSPTQQSPQQTFLSLSISTLPSLQNQTHFSNINISQPSNHPRFTNQSNQAMQDETTTENTSKTYSDNYVSHSGQKQIVSGLIEANIKSQKLPRQNENLKNSSKLMPGYKSQTILINSNEQQMSQQIKSQITKNISSTQKNNRPLPSYVEARPALYVWIRNLCRQMNMSFDVLALTMKYLDEYHLTYGHSYNRSTFTLNAYGMIILASKLMNKQILTPKVISQKIMVSQQLLQSLQIKLIQMMSFKVYFQTYVKELQRKLQNWENICQRLCLKEELSFFSDDIFSFKRFYSLIGQVQRMAKLNIDVTQEMLLVAFIKSLSGQFKKDYKAQKLLTEILTEVFETLTRKFPNQYSFQHILERIKNEIDVEDEDLWEQMKKCYDQREKKEVFMNYNVFLNSILDIKI